MFRSNADIKPTGRQRCVVIGPGRWGRVLLPHISANFDIAAIVTKGSPATQRWLTRNCAGVLATADLDEALSLEGVETVIIATPTSSHAELAQRALQAGCHVFVEKPLALNVAEAEATMQAATARNLEVFIGYVFLFHPALEILRSVAPSHCIRSIQFEWVRPGLIGRPRDELLCHELALTIALTDEIPLSLHVQQDDQSTFRCLMRMPSSRPVSTVLLTGSSGPKQKKLTLECEDGAVHQWCDDKVTIMSRGETRSVHCASSTSVPRELAAFRAAAAGTGPRMADDLRLSVGITELLDPGLDEGSI